MFSVCLTHIRLTFLVFYIFIRNFAKQIENGLTI